MSQPGSAQSAIDEYVAYLRSFPRFSAQAYLQLERIQLLLKYLGSPENKLKGFQVAGTNGKGSTTALIASVLRTAGYHTGAFFSPHLVSYTERIQINGQPIAERDLMRLLRRLKPIVKKVEEELADRPTWFEVLTAAAALWFSEQKVDWVVFEVGLGGRLDSTTALNLKYKAITDISKDHTHILGRTIKAIAGEKAGIVQPGSIVVTSNTGIALQVIKKRSRQVGARLLPASRATSISISLNGTSFHIHLNQLNLPINLIYLRLVGHRQAVNAGLAFDVTQKALRLPVSTIRQGLERATLPARFQILRRQPLTILDGAHNPGAIRELIKIIQRLKLNKGKLVIVFAAKETKDYARMIGQLKMLTPRMYFPKLTIPNMVAARELRRACPRGRVMSDLKSALKQATLKAGKSGAVLITGSLYLAGEVLKQEKK